MSLSDAMGAAGLSAFAQAGLIVSFLAFAAVVAWALLRPREEMRDRARSVLDEGEGGRAEGPAGNGGG